MKSIMDLMGPELSELSALELENLPYYTPVKDGTYYGITRGGAASSSLSGAYL